MHIGFIAFAATLLNLTAIAQTPGVPHVDECRPFVVGGPTEDGFTCPCSNQPTTPGAGCDGYKLPAPSTALTGGALMSLSGTASLSGGTPGVDTLQIAVQGLPMLATESAFLVQGTASLGPLPFSQGLRCCGGTNLRIQIHAGLVSGTSVWPAAGDFQRTIQARSAQLGGPIAPNTTRCYFIMYRASNGLPFCLGNFSSSQSATIFWVL